MAIKGTNALSVTFFLDACTPSIVDHAQQFVDFGCSTEVYLFAVSQWAKKTIHKFLEKVSSRGPARLLEMDILILQNHFLTYFA